MDIEKHLESRKNQKKAQKNNEKQEGKEFVGSSRYFVGYRGFSCNPRNAAMTSQILFVSVFHCFSLFFCAFLTFSIFFSVHALGMSILYLFGF